MNGNKKKVLIIILLLLSGYYFFVGRYEIVVYNKLRYFKSKIKASSLDEKIVLDSFKFDITDEFEKLKDIYVDNENIVEIHKSRKAEKANPRKITINSLKEINEKDYTDLELMDKYYSFIERLREYNPYEHKVIEVNYNIVYYPKHAAGAQWGNGNWTRYYVVTREKEDSDWKLFDVYWQI